MATPGRLPDSSLSKIQADGARLLTPTSRAWARMKDAAKKELGRSIASAGEWGAYRTAYVQHQMHLAGAGRDPAAKRRWNLNPNSTVKIADDPYGTHEHGDRVDIVGTGMDAKFLALAARFGFTREFGASDPNHFIHDGKTAVSVKIIPTSKKVYVTVRSGDMLGKIAAEYRTTVARVMGLNPSIKNANLIRVGQRVRVS